MYLFLGALDFDNFVELVVECECPLLRRLLSKQVDAACLCSSDFVHGVTSLSFIASFGASAADPFGGRLFVEAIGQVVWLIKIFPEH